MRKRLFLALLTVLPACTGNELCGIAFCSEQTHIQMDYDSHRDLCRRLSQMKAQEFPEKGTDADGKARLVTLFSECMNEKGWTVPSPQADKKADTGGAAKPPVPVQLKDTPEYRQRRAAECSFARHDAPYSLTARNTAQACDAECADLRGAAPEAPKPAACP